MNKHLKTAGIIISATFGFFLLIAIIAGLSQKPKTQPQPTAQQTPQLPTAHVGGTLADIGDVKAYFIKKAEQYFVDSDVIDLEGRLKSTVHKVGKNKDGNIEVHLSIFYKHSGDPLPQNKNPFVFIMRESDGHFIQIIDGNNQDKTPGRR